METVSFTKEGLITFTSKTSGVTREYKKKLIDDLFEAQKAISEGEFEKEDN